MKIRVIYDVEFIQIGIEEPFTEDFLEFRLYFLYPVYVLNAAVKLCNLEGLD